MVQPSPVLFARVRFTTKQVGFGFYRGNKTGSVGAHTQYGGYLVDWRKVRNYAVPDLANFKLTPYVTKEIEYKAEPIESVQKINLGEGYKTDPLTRRALPFLASWRASNYQEFTDFITHQYNETKSERESEAVILANEGGLNELHAEEKGLGEQVQQEPTILTSGSNTIDSTAQASLVQNLSPQQQAAGDRRKQEKPANEEARRLLEEAREQAREERVETWEQARREEKEQQTARQKEIAQRHQVFKVAMKNTPREFQVGKTEKQKRSKNKELRKFVKKMEAQHGGVSPEFRKQEMLKQTERREILEAKQSAALKTAFKGRARQMAKKLSA